MKSGMRIKKEVGRGVQRIALLAILVGGAVLSSQSGPVFTSRDKAFYKDANIVNFVRPGLVVKITQASIAQDGTITARVTVQDPQGLGLDRLGVTTPGAVSISFIAGTIPKGQTQYTAYTTRVVTSPITNKSATQAGTDTGGVWTVNGDGDYTYRFGIKAPANIDRNATHSIGLYSSRNLTQFDMGTQYSNDVYNFVPDGTAVKTVRDVARTENCNKCHNPLSAHGGARQKVELCIMCHTPQTTDPDTGNTVDFKVMVHKIHDGSSLPSVKAKVPYQIIGFNQTVVDFSTVVFPADVRRCEVCHESKAAQANNYLTNPNRAACGSCHDDVNFASGKNHVDLPQVTDNQCSQCHTPQGELEFDASIKGAHTIPEFSRDLAGTTFGIVKVDDAAPGKKPTVTFTLRDKNGKAILPSDMTSLQLRFGGPTVDYATLPISNDVRPAKGNPDGTYFWTFDTAIPADAKGSYTFAIQGYRNLTLMPGTAKQVVVRDVGQNKLMTVSIDGKPVVERRLIVSIDKCNNCHVALRLHGGSRNETKYCVMCHNPNTTDNATPPTGVSFASMVHKIHTGEELTVDYTISNANFNDVRFPGDRRDCTTCHVNDSQQLPVKAVLQVRDPRGPIDPVGPTTAACTGCHNDIAVASHALSNTTKLGEACSTCHGPASEFSVNKVHAR